MIYLISLFNLFYLWLPIPLNDSQVKPKEGFKKVEFIRQHDTLRGQFLYNNIPTHTKEKYPLIIFLHGAGERGSDNELQMIHANLLFNESYYYPSYVFVPQCAIESYWSNVEVDFSKTYPNRFKFNYNPVPTKALSMLMEWIDSTLKLGMVDTNRIYLVGLSMGSAGTYELLSRLPNRFAAAVSICGGVHPLRVKDFANKVPVWIFHGDKDQVVDVRNSLSVFKELQDYKANPKLTIYKDVDHNSWVNAFKEPHLLEWLFSNTRLKK